MRKKSVDRRLYYMFVFFLGSATCSYFFFFDSGLQGFTGKVTGNGVVSITQSGIAGVSLTGVNVSFGSGYYNSTGDCSSQDYSSLDSNNSAARNNDLGAASVCWINTTSFLGGDNRSGFTLVNNGSVNVNISVTAGNNGETWLCGGDCPLTDSAALSVFSSNAEASSCSGLTTGFEELILPNSVSTVGICDSLNFADSEDSINIYVNASVPKDMTTGEKSLILTFEALAM